MSARWSMRLLLPGCLLVGGCAVTASVEQIDLFPGYGTSSGVLIDGRMVTRRAAADDITVDDARPVNIRRNAALFLLDELEGRPVEVALAGGRGSQAVTDDDGYFTLEVAATGRTGRTGWVDVIAGSGGVVARDAALVVPDDSVVGIISDIDDTVLVTQVTDVSRMLANTLLLNPLQRTAVPDIAALYARVLARNPDPAKAPMFYLSSSPDQLDRYLRAFLSHNDLPRGVLITRRIDLSGEGDPLRDAVAYKSAEIEKILERVPDVPFILVGDDGEHDPETYALVRERHPQRIEAIWIRRTGAGPWPPLPDGQVELDRVLRSAANEPARSIPRQPGAG